MKRKWEKYLFYQNIKEFIAFKMIKKKKKHQLKAGVSYCDLFDLH